MLRERLGEARMDLPDPLVGSDDPEFQLAARAAIALVGAAGTDQGAPTDSGQIAGGRDGPRLRHLRSHRQRTLHLERSPQKQASPLTRSRPSLERRREARRGRFHRPEVATIPPSL